MPNELEKDIYRTVAYFSYFKYPVTSFEIFKWLLQPDKDRTYSEISSALQSSAWLKVKLQKQKGFYSLDDISDQIKTRHRRFLNAVEKYKKLKKVLIYVSRVPGVKGVALCNSLPLHFTRKGSDIDLFIISEDNKIWSTRLLTVLPMILLRQRPGEVKINPVDMSFFATESNLEFQKLKMNKFDPYMSVWIRTLVPVYEKKEGVFENFLEENIWARKDLPNSILSRRTFRKRSKIKSKLPLFVGEHFAEGFQRRKFPEDIQSLQNIDSRIVVNNKMLKFHKNDRRQKVAQNLMARMHV